MSKLYSTAGAGKQSDPYPYSIREENEILRAQLLLEQASFKSHWRELSDYILPRRARFYTTDVDKGDRRNLKIINNTATLASRTLRAGMMGGVTSPARPWFRLAVPDPSLSDSDPVKDWLFEVSNRMNIVFLRSNLYNSLPILYGDLGTFGTAAMLIEEDFTGEVIRTYSFPIGSYRIANDDKGRVRTYQRDFRMTVRQLVEKFGIDRATGKIDWTPFSSMVKDYWDRKLTETWIDVCHTIKPNKDYDPKKPHSRYKQFVSVYYERGSAGNPYDPASFSTDTDPNKVLKLSGYDYFPVLVPRWEVTGEDVYATSCPGMDALGDIKGLQTAEKRSAQAVEKQINPPMQAPASMRNSKTSLLPGDVTYADLTAQGHGMKPIHEVNFNITQLEDKMRQLEQRISKAYYEDLFLMLSESDRREITATEIDERKEEKLLALGPVLEQLNQDLLDPLIDITFQIMVKQGLIPPPPQQIQGMPLQVQYISIMANAQKLIGIGAIERFTQYMTGVIQTAPSAAYKINVNELVNQYADAVGVPPQIINSDEDAQASQQAAQQQQQQAQQAAQMNQASQTAKNLAQSPVQPPSGSPGGTNALQALMAQAQAGNPNQQP